MAETWMITPRGNRLGSRLGGTRLLPGSPPTAGLPHSSGSGIQWSSSQSGDSDAAAGDTPPDLDRSGEGRRRRRSAALVPRAGGRPSPTDVRPHDRTQTLSRARRCRRGRHRRIAITRQKATSVLIVVVEGPSRLTVPEHSDTEPWYEDRKARQSSAGDLDTPGTPSTHSEFPRSAPEYERAPKAMSRILDEK